MPAALALVLLLLLAGALRAAHGEPPVPGAPPAPPPPALDAGVLLGIAGVAPAGDDPALLGRLPALAGLGGAVLESVPVAWGALDPRPPDHPVARYDWQPLDELVLGARRAGLTPRLVLSPASPWASQAPETTDYARFLRAQLPEAEARAALAAVQAVAPPTERGWREWERFLRDLFERYDADGVRDVPGLTEPLREVQILDRADLGTRWLGSVEEYQRLLFHAKEAAGTAAPRLRIAHAAVDLRGLVRPGDEPERWRERLAGSVPATPPLLRLEAERSLTFVLRALDTPLVYDVLPQAGSGSLAEDALNVTALRGLLDARGLAGKVVIVTDGPTRRLSAPRADVPAERVGDDEARLRARLLPAALRGEEAGAARRWLRRGTAYDLVRGAALCRAAGAEQVITHGLTDLGGRAPGEEGPRLGDQGFLRPVPGAAGLPVWERTASYHAAAQWNRLLRGHRRADTTPLGASGRAVVFRFAESSPRPWVALLMLDPARSWAGPEDGPAARALVRVPLPAGDVELEEVAVGEAPPERRRARVVDGVLEIELGPAPVYVLPASGG